MQYGEKKKLRLIYSKEICARRWHSEWKKTGQQEGWFQLPQNEDI